MTQPPNSTNSPVARRRLQPLNIPDEQIDRILRDCVAAINGQVPLPDDLLLAAAKFARGTTPLATAGFKAPARKPRKPSLSSVAKAASKAAIAVARYEVKPDGTVVVVIGEPTTEAASNEWDPTARRAGQD